jgi:hypothetical protein
VVATTVLVNMVLLMALCYQQFFIGGASAWLWVPYGLFLVFLARRARRLKRRVSALVGAAAVRCGLVVPGANS